MTLDEILELFPDNSTGEISAADIRTALTALYEDTEAVALEVAGHDARLDALEAETEGYAQVFSYLWTNTAGPAVGKATVDAWSMAGRKVQINETTDDGQNLGFGVLDAAASAEIRLLTADGKKLIGTVTADSVDHGSYRDVAFLPTAVVGAAPTLNQKIAVAIVVREAV
jgi:hypothetical protein